MFLRHHPLQWGEWRGGGGVIKIVYLFGYGKQHKWQKAAEIFEISSKGVRDWGGKHFFLFCIFSPWASYRWMAGEEDALGEVLVTWTVFFGGWKIQYRGIFVLPSVLT